MEIKEIIEKGIEGGWGNYKDRYSINNNGVIRQTAFGDVLDKTYYEILLDPKFWKAVGKVEGWEDKDCLGCKRVPHFPANCLKVRYCGKQFKENMHQMIDHLCSGGTIEEFIKTL